MRKPNDLRTAVRSSTRWGAKCSAIFGAVVLAAIAAGGAPRATASVQAAPDHGAPDHGDSGHIDPTPIDPTPIDLAPIDLAPIDLTHTGPSHAVSSADRHRVALSPAHTIGGYVALLLVNETPFPNEPGWVSEQDTRAAMVSILSVLENRLRHVPPGYRQEHIAAQRCHDIIDVITAGGKRGQCDGFYRDGSGRFVAVPRVHERVAYLVECANRGEPGPFARLLQFADELSTRYAEEGIEQADRFAGITGIGDVAVTGRAYSWMTARDRFHPGGNFVAIPESKGGVLGGNRFFTLKRLN